MKVTAVTSATATDVVDDGACPANPLRAWKARTVPTSISPDNTITRSPFCWRMAMVPGGAADHACAGDAAAAGSASCRPHRRASPHRRRRSGARRSLRCGRLGRTDRMRLLIMSPTMTTASTVVPLPGREPPMSTRTAGRVPASGAECLSSPLDELEVADRPDGHRRSGQAAHGDRDGADRVLPGVRPGVAGLAPEDSEEAAGPLELRRPHP